MPLGLDHYLKGHNDVEHWRILFCLAAAVSQPIFTTQRNRHRFITFPLKCQSSVTFSKDKYYQSSIIFHFRSTPLATLSLSCLGLPRSRNGTDGKEVNISDL